MRRNSNSGLIEHFLHRLVTVKTSEGFIAKGTLWRVDPNHEHYQPIGNLILADRTIIRGNQVQAICSMHSSHFVRARPTKPYKGV